MQDRPFIDQVNDEPMCMQFNIICSYAVHKMRENNTTNENIINNCDSTIIAAMLVFFFFKDFALFIWAVKYSISL